tara:strand:+ start:338 stop:703 length:366 start_codon:yes stop_codon:yes gene_type:complete
MDVLMVIFFLANFAATAITNVMVVKDLEQADIEYEILEVNPVAAERAGYVEHPDGPELMYIFIEKTIWYALLAFWYILLRKWVYSDLQMWIFTFFVLFSFFPLVWNFANDFGYWIGVLKYG